MAVRSVKSKKTSEEIPAEEQKIAESVSATRLKTTKTDPFAVLLKIFSDLQAEFESLQKEIILAYESWSVEQEAHIKDTKDQAIQEELERKRDKETYEYETARKRKIAEDEFADKKAAWEKQLKDQQEILQKEKTELVELRKIVEGFAAEKEKAIVSAQEVLQKELVGKFETEKKLKEQEQKAEKDIFNLKIATLTSENNRLNIEIETLKKTLEEATKQVKDIAVKVIESGTKLQASEANSVN